MELSFLDWVFVALIVGCVVFLLQILLSYNQQTFRLRPQIREMEQVRERHEEEIKKVERLIEESEEETAELDEELAQLEARHKALEEVMRGLEKEDEEA